MHRSNTSVVKREGKVLERVKYSVPLRVENNYEGLMFFSKAYTQLKEVEDKLVIFDFSRTTWFEANLVAVFSGIVQTLKKQGCQVVVRKVNHSIKLIFKKNGFYKHYNLGEEVDVYDSTIPFHKFHVDDGEGFTEYLNEEVIPKIKLPLTEEQIRTFKKCLQEVFENASNHANSDYVFTCGQYYHTKQKVAFTIVDVGQTIGKNVRKKIPELIDCDAIEWATGFGNTTKVAKDGGIGLNFLKDYLWENGTLQIISGKGYWEQDLDKIFNRNTPYAFGGTIVNIISDLKGEVKTKRKIEF
ncbi:hypothetical protein [Bacillus wiedmannii]|uniref:hypothetical protein n=1 Tax=Bacillus wiedmannii TaxID=1890302 RepID=UPI001D0DEEAB|nr:hypothetical protein [Bacillus wiedmannii]MCC2327149.1 hypothetical protein [Bacillus wiedmannii]